MIKKLIIAGFTAASLAIGMGAASSSAEAHGMFMGGPHMCWQHPGMCHPGGPHWPHPPGPPPGPMGWHPGWHPGWQQPVFGFAIGVQQPWGPPMWHHRWHRHLHHMRHHHHPRWHHLYY